MMPPDQAVQGVENSLRQAEEICPDAMLITIYQLFTHATIERSDPFRAGRVFSIERSSRLPPPEMARSEARFAFSRVRMNERRAACEMEEHAFGDLYLPALL